MRFTVVMLVAGLLSLAIPSAAQTVDGFRHTSFSISFDGSTVSREGGANGLSNPDLTFKDVTFGVTLPILQNLSVWLNVSKAASWNEMVDASGRHARGAFAGGLSYRLLQQGRLYMNVVGGISSRLERIGDGMINPTALKIGGKVGVRLFGESGDHRWFGIFLVAGEDVGLRDIVDMDNGSTVKGTILPYWRLGMEFSL